jgi:hypothetical protein
MNVREQARKDEGLNIKMSGTTGPDSSLDIPSAIRGQVIIAFSASFRRHGGDGRESGIRRDNGQGAELSFMLYTRRDP